jgi:hypothetical protein
MNMDDKGKEKQNIFIAVVIVGAVTVLGTVLSSVDRQSKFLVLFGVALFLLIMYGIFFGIPRIIKKIKFRPKPKLKYWFELPNKNDLKLYIENPKGVKAISASVYNTDILTLGRKKYQDEFPNDLKYVGNSSGGGHPLFFGDLKTNDKREIQIGFDYGGKLAIRYFSVDSPVYGFRDGTFEYVILCVVQHSNQSFMLPDYIVWLVIKDGALVDIRQ